MIRHNLPATCDSPPEYDGGGDVYLEFRHPEEDVLPSYSESNATPRIQNTRRLNLMQAAWEGNQPLVQSLIDAGADVNRKYRDGMTPLIGAAFMGHLDVIRHLTTRQAKLNIQDDDGYTALMSAASHGHLAIVKFLADNGADFESTSRMNQQSALMLAAMSGHTTVVEYLLSRGARVDLLDYYGEGIIYHAAKGGYLDIVMMLLGAEAPLHEIKGRLWFSSQCKEAVVAKQFKHMAVYKLLNEHWKKKS